MGTQVHPIVTQHVLKVRKTAMTVRRKLANWDRAVKRTLVSLLYQAPLRCMLQNRQAAYRRDQSVCDFLVGLGNFVTKNK